MTNPKEKGAVAEEAASVRADALDFSERMRVTPAAPSHGREGDDVPPAIIDGQFETEARQVADLRLSRWRARAWRSWSGLGIAWWLHLHRQVVARPSGNAAPRRVPAVVAASRKPWVYIARRLKWLKWLKWNVLPWVARALERFRGGAAPCRLASRRDPAGDDYRCAPEQHIPGGMTRQAERSMQLSMRLRGQQRAGDRHAERLSEQAARGRDTRRQARLAGRHPGHGGNADLAVDHAHAHAEQPERHEETRIGGKPGEPRHRVRADHQRRGHRSAAAIARRRSCWSARPPATGRRSSPRRSAAGTGQLPVLRNPARPAGKSR